MLRWFGHIWIVDHRPLLTPLRAWRETAEDVGKHTQRRPGTIEKGLGEHVKLKFAQDRRAWSASTRDLVNSIGDSASTRPG